MKLIFAFLLTNVLVAGFAQAEDRPYERGVLCADIVDVYGDLLPGVDPLYEKMEYCRRTLFFHDNGTSLHVSIGYGINFIYCPVVRVSSKQGIGIGECNVTHQK